MDEAVCVIDPDAELEHMSASVAGQGLAFILGLKGEPVLHASLVRTEELAHEALALVGGPVAGKSTMAALLCAAGASFVTNDVARISLREDGAYSLGGCDELRLPAHASRTLAAFGATPPCRGTPAGEVIVRLNEDPVDGEVRVMSGLVRAAKAIVGATWA